MDFDLLAELRLASLIKSGLSSKECASILHVSSKTIENQRVSIRKKLDLPRESNLTLYLKDLDSKI